MISRVKGFGKIGIDRLSNASAINFINLAKLKMINLNWVYNRRRRLLILFKYKDCSISLTHLHNILRGLYLWIYLL